MKSYNYNQIKTISKKLKLELLTMIFIWKFKNFKKYKQ